MSNIKDCPPDRRVRLQRVKCTNNKIVNDSPGSRLMNEVSSLKICLNQPSLASRHQMKEQSVKINNFLSVKHGHNSNDDSIYEKFSGKGDCVVL